MTYNINVSGTVHAAEDIINPVAYARATFNDTTNLHVTAIGRKLKFHYTHGFTCYNIQEQLAALVSEHSNVDWTLEVSQ